MRANKSIKMSESTIYKIVVDRHNPQASLDYIREVFYRDLTADFEEGIDDNGEIPRGLISQLARKYNYSSGGISKHLQRAGKLVPQKNKGVKQP